MKLLTLLIIGAVFTGCMITDNGISINPPKPQVDICLNAVTDPEVATMKTQVEAQSFKTEKLAKGKMLAKDRCFTTNQVVILMSGFTFEDNKIEIAKYLYKRTSDRVDYETVVDALTYMSSKRELRDYIAAEN
ncbi:MAG: hypothetical protein ACI837_002057 [Crocinitomicaceae bacterium]|jgi:hypothetical protein